MINPSTTRPPLLAAAAGLQPTRRPVWFMRQAGRSLPEYRRIRAGIGMLESCFNPELVCEITLQPVRRHGVDAAILFSDIVVPLKAAGVGLDIVADVGPVVEQPVRGRSDVRAFPRLRAEQVGAVADAVRLITDELPADVALIGFAGAPFTLASYLVEGGPSRSHARTKAMMYEDPASWRELLGTLTDMTLVFLRAQLDAGVDAIQLFDSWVGALSAQQYRTYVAGHSERIFAELDGLTGRRGEPVPRIHFGVGAGELLGALGESGADVIGVDWRVPLGEAARRVGNGKALQGNLDPAVLLAGNGIVHDEVARVVTEGDAAVASGAAGHIFNLGHGVLPGTDPGVLTAIVDQVHAL